jgi:hypothetical protein
MDATRRSGGCSKPPHAPYTNYGHAQRIVWPDWPPWKGHYTISLAAQLYAGLLLASDDVRVLATSREPLRAAREARYRLGR